MEKKMHNRGRTGFPVDEERCGFSLDGQRSMIDDPYARMRLETDNRGGDKGYRRSLTESNMSENAKQSAKHDCTPETRDR